MVSLNIGLGFNLGGKQSVSNGGASDADAILYLEALEIAGTSPTSSQVTAIDNFFIAAKANGYYSKLKNFKFPVWGVASSNAVDMVGGTGGTFNGAMTHANGYIQGDDSTAYLDMGTSPAAIGMSDSDGFLCALIYSATSAGIDGIMACRDSGLLGECQLSIVNLATEQGKISNGPVITNATISTVTSAEGIFTVNRTSPTSMRMTHLDSSGLTYGANQGTDTTGNAIASSNMYCMAGNNAGSGIYIASDYQVGFAIMGVGFSDAEVDLLTADLKTLWETVTGLTIP